MALSVASARRVPGVIGSLLILSWLIGWLASPGPPSAAGEPDRPTIAKLIDQLGSPSFAARQDATERLKAIGAPALEPLHDAVRNPADLEIRRRAEKLILDIHRRLFVEVRRFEGHKGAGPYQWVTRARVTPDGRQIFSCAGDGLRSWDLAVGTPLHVFEAHTKGNWALALSRDGRRVIVGGNDGDARVFEVATGRLVRRLPARASEVWGVALSDDGTRAVTGAWDHTVRAWDVEVGKPLWTAFRASEKPRCLALAPAGDVVAVGHFLENRPGTIRLWDAVGGEEMRALAGHKGEVSGVAFSPDGKTLLSSSFDRTVRLWDVASGKELRCLEGHTGRVEGAAFSPDGRYALSCGDETDGTIRLWDVARGRALLYTEPVPGGLLSVAWAPDGRHCVTAGKDGLVRLWRWNR